MASIGYYEITNIVPEIAEVVCLLLGCNQMPSKHRFGGVLGGIFFEFSGNVLASPSPSVLSERVRTR